MTPLFGRIHRFETFHGGLQTLIILGDSGYPTRTYLLTPFNPARTPAELRYNEAHCVTRVCVERTFGLLKSRFRCLAEFGGHVLYAPDQSLHSTGLLQHVVFCTKLLGRIKGLLLEFAPDVCPVLHIQAGDRNVQWLVVTSAVPFSRREFKVSQTSSSSSY